MLGERYHHHLQQRAEAVEQAREQLQAVIADAEDAEVVVPDELWDDLTPAELGDVLRSSLPASSWTAAVDRSADESRCSRRG
jgi:uncharacterized membrane protein